MMENRTLHERTFGYLKPTEAQAHQMEVLRLRAKQYADVLETELPAGPDKTFVLRQLRTLAMWANVAVTRNPDGSPRDQSLPQAKAGDIPPRPELGHG